MNNKEERQQQIIEIIQAKRISRQEDLLEKLLTHGFSLTQATLSRDLKELKVGKIPDPKEGSVYFVSSTNSKHNELHGLTTIVFTRDLVLLKCLPGFANSIAASIDDSDMETVAGTIAGNDTTLVILKDNVGFKEFKINILQQFSGIEYLF